MAKVIPESDWKLFREIHAVALARFCERVLAEVTHLATDSSTSSHKRYLLVFELIRQRNEDIAAAFNDMRRSTALQQLAEMQFHELLTEDEFARFSPETREAVNTFVEFFREQRGMVRRRGGK